jgi:ribosomal protein S18 acetylase RimI-like enzyme
MMNIRPFQESDADGVTALWREVFPDDPPHNAPAASIRRKLAVQRELFFVAEIDARIVGTVMAGYDGHRGWLYAVAVSPRLRRRGIGGALVRHAEAALGALGCPKINLQVRASNAGVVAFYETLGYRVEERISLGKRLGPAEDPT